jgi:hypothetical protein
MRCYAHEVGDTADAWAVAEFTCVPSENRVMLCQKHLDMWFDNADDEPDLEPGAVRWLDGSRTLTGHPLGVLSAEPAVRWSGREWAEIRDAASRPILKLVV